jgi:hypothetical protein
MVAVTMMASTNPWAMATPASPTSPPVALSATTEPAPMNTNANVAKHSATRGLSFVGMWFPRVMAV